MVHLVNVGGEELLWYRAPPRIDVALIRGTTADLDGNVSFEREALFLDSLNQVSSKASLVFSDRRGRELTAAIAAGPLSWVPAWPSTCMWDACRCTFSRLCSMPGERVLRWIAAAVPRRVQLQAVLLC